MRHTARPLRDRRTQLQHAALTAGADSERSLGLLDLVRRVDRLSNRLRPRLEEPDSIHGQYASVIGE